MTLSNARRLTPSPRMSPPSPSFFEPKCIFSKCNYPMCIFAKWTRLACLPSFASLLLLSGRKWDLRKRFWGIVCVFGIEFWWPGMIYKGYWGDLDFSCRRTDERTNGLLRGPCGPNDQSPDWEWGLSWLFLLLQLGRPGLVHIVPPGRLEFIHLLWRHRLLHQQQLGWNVLSCAALLCHQNGVLVSGRARAGQWTLRTAGASALGQDTCGWGRLGKG